MATEVTTADTVGLLTALADPTRLAVVGWIAEQPTPPRMSDLASRFGVELRPLQRIVATLVAAGLVDQVEGGLVVRVDRIAAAADAQLATQPMAEFAAADARFGGSIRHGIIERLPPNLQLAQALLDEVVRHIPADRDLNETEITETLATLSTDPALLRRALVDSGRVDRTPDGATYRRIRR